MFINAQVNDLCGLMTFWRFHGATKNNHSLVLRIIADD